MGVRVPPFASIPYLVTNHLSAIIQLKKEIYPMDCCAFCTATSYQMKPLFDALRFRFKAEMIREVIHAEILLDQTTVNAFFFPYGVVVCWGIDRGQGTTILNVIKEFETGPVEDLEVDEFSYTTDEKTLKVVEDMISMPEDDVFLKLAFSHAIAQSVKLGSFEVRMQKAFVLAQQLPEDLAKKGKIGLSRKQICQKMGSLFLERNSVNLYLDVLDTPDFFWDHPELETGYKMMANYLDVKSRVEVLNQRLSILNELYQMLGNELNHQHSSRLEWTIILLIVIEVIVSMLRDVLKII